MSQQSPASRQLQARAGASATAMSKFAADVAQGLLRNPRQLPPQYLHDALGSTLHEAICKLPWCQSAVAEAALLESQSAAILDACRPLAEIVELGPCNGEKLARLLDARGATGDPLKVHLIDDSQGAIDAADRWLDRMSALEVVHHRATHVAGLARIGLNTACSGRRLALLLESGLGRFDPLQSRGLLRQIHASLRPGDMFLLGADLIKPARELLLAYDDPLGLSAAFNLNLLLRINRELGGNFNVEGFDYLAAWNGGSSRVECQLVSNRRQTVRIPTAGLAVTLQDRDAICIGKAYKHTLDHLCTMLEGAGLRLVEAWTHDAARFALVLAQRERDSDAPPVKSPAALH